MDIKYIIFNSESEANARNLLAWETLQPTINDPNTTGYALIKKHPTADKWALPITDFEHLFTEDEISNAAILDDTWDAIEEEIT
ncbi:MAG: hypothetical protein PHE56_16550 [Bacteroidales bacterium]|nr:hypothetical protein [Bacteroidales bacterium]